MGENSQNTRLMNDLRVFAEQIETFTMKSGSFPEDSKAGDIPTGFEGYIKADRWEDGPSIRSE